MNASIRKVAIVTATLFAILMLNVTFNTVVRASALLEDNRNKRIRDAEYSQDRGAILVGDTAIAKTTQVTTPGFKYQRSYAQGPLYAHVTGYYSYLYSRSGLEQSYNAPLAGTDASQAFARFIDILSGRKPTGANLLTTIDSRAQKAAAEAIGNRRGAVIAMNYATGEILAMYSSPTYDPNMLATNNVTAQQEAWKKFEADPAAPLLNRGTTEVFLPGSTFKLVTTAAALESGLNPDSLLDAPDKFQLPGSTHFISNAGSCGSTQVSLQEALVVSCNTAFAKLGMTLGADALRDQATKFGFGTDFDTDFRTAASRFPKAPDKAQTALSAIGLYDVAASPLQMLMVASAIANDGVLMKPYLGRRVVARDLSILSSKSPTELGKPISGKTAAAMRAMMREVVTDGTARAANSDAVQISAKTGTAMQDPSLPNYAWMVGFANDPKIAVVAMVQDADSARSDISGGRLAGPIVRQVIEAVR